MAVLSITHCSAGQAAVFHLQPELGPGHGAPHPGQLAGLHAARASFVIAHCCAVMQHTLVLAFFGFVCVDVGS
jgi:hypothetical protein